MKTRTLLIPIIILVAAVVVVAPFVIHPAEAHILKTFNMTGMSGNIAVKIGWLNEPPLVGDTNQIDLFVYNGTDDSAPPIANTGLDNMKVTIQYGGKTKALSFNPSDDTPGLYTATVIPSQLGTYNVIIQGTIGGMTIQPTTYPMQEVEAKDKYNFP